MKSCRVKIKIVRGNIELLQDIHLIPKEKRVSETETHLLSLLGILPLKSKLKIAHLIDLNNANDKGK
jgi:hypothetical protein